MIIAQRWGLASAAPLVQLNGLDPDLLGGTHWSQEGTVASIRNMLARDWGVDSPAALLQTLEWLRTTGHRSEYDHAFASWRSGAPVQPAHQHFLAQYSETVGAVSLIAWDSVRLGALAGWGHLSGFMDEKTAWQWVMAGALAAQSGYRSWQEYGTHYLLGYEFWSGEPPDAELQAVIQDLLRRESSPWRALAFNTPLTVPGLPPGPGFVLPAGVEQARVQSSAGNAQRLLYGTNGAELVEHSGTRRWIDRVNGDILREQWGDVWGPLEGLANPLEEFCYHEHVFNLANMNDAPAAEQRLLEFGYQSVGQFFQVRTTVNKYWGRPVGPTLSETIIDGQEYQGAILKAQQRHARTRDARQLENDAGLMSPIEGVGFDLYVHVVARQAGGATEQEVNALLAGHGIDLPTFVRAGQAWLTRMQNDTSGALARKYGEAFMSQGSGTYGAAAQAVAAGNQGTAPAGSEPVPIEKMCEISGAIAAWSETGQDINTQLTQVFGITAVDYGNISTWWMNKMTSDLALLSQYNERVAAYTERYRGGKTNIGTGLNF